MPKDDRARLISVVLCDRMSGSGHKLKHRRFQVSIRKKKNKWGWSDYETDCPERLWHLHYWRSSNPGWKWPVVSKGLGSDYFWRCLPAFTVWWFLFLWCLVCLHNHWSYSQSFCSPTDFYSNIQMQRFSYERVRYWKLSCSFLRKFHKYLPGVPKECV